mmetsp:Transcript_26243/g.72062  ORF Transcript_26243/g.72062 Transcript_26243/m.72062 type:complete len:510 (-) Transcript_26243:185-1714(-)
MPFHAIPYRAVWIPRKADEIIRHSSFGMQLRYRILDVVANTPSSNRSSRCPISSFPIGIETLPRLATATAATTAAHHPSCLGRRGILPPLVPAPVVDPRLGQAQLVQHQRHRADRDAGPARQQRRPLRQPIQGIVAQGIGEDPLQVVPRQERGRVVGQGQRSVRDVDRTGDVPLLGKGRSAGVDDQGRAVRSQLLLLLPFQQVQHKRHVYQTVPRIGRNPGMETARRVVVVVVVVVVVIVVVIVIINELYEISGPQCSVSAAVAAQWLGFDKSPLSFPFLKGSLQQSNGTAAIILFEHVPHSRGKARPVSAIDHQRRAIITTTTTTTIAVAAVTLKVIRQNPHSFQCGTHQPLGRKDVLEALRVVLRKEFPRGGQIGNVPVKGTGEPGSGLEFPPPISFTLVKPRGVHESDGWQSILFGSRAVLQFRPVIQALGDGPQVVRPGFDRCLAVAAASFTTFNTGDRTSLRTPVPPESADPTPSVAGSDSCSGQQHTVHQFYATDARNHVECR